MYETGFQVATVRNQSVSIRLRGSAIELRKSAAKSSGKMPWTASPDPVRSATNAPMPPKPSEISRASAPITSAPGTPEWIPSPATAPTDRNAVAWIRPSASTPASWPTSSALRLNGVSERRFRKPDLHVARHVRAGAVRREQAALDEADGEHEVEVVVRGEARKLGGALEAAAVHGEQ